MHKTLYIYIYIYTCSIVIYIYIYTHRRLCARHTPITPLRWRDGGGYGFITSCKKRANTNFIYEQILRRQMLYEQVTTHEQILYTSYNKRANTKTADAMERSCMDRVVETRESTD